MENLNSIATAFDRRAAYKGETILGQDLRLSTDIFENHINNNMLVLGSSGAGKTRNVVKPNLMQMHGSYIVLDTKGLLYKEVGPLLAENGYQVDCLDFTDMSGTVGYNPLRYIRKNPDGTYSEQDVMSIAYVLCPESPYDREPFWQQCAAKLVASYIAYVMEALPESRHTMSDMLSICNASIDQAKTVSLEAAFNALGAKNPTSMAARLYRETKSMGVCDRTYASVLAFVHTSLFPFNFAKARDAYRREPQVDFEAFAREKHALFVRVDDLDKSLSPLVNIFITQSAQSLCDFADQSDGGCLPVPVHYFLDDFANLKLKDIDTMLSVIRSREVSMTIICQSISQLIDLYGSAKADSIVGNCGIQQVLSFQDETTARYFSNRANRTPSALYTTPHDLSWVFLANQAGQCVKRFDVADHPAYHKVAAHERFGTNPPIKSDTERSVYEPLQ